MAEPPSASTTQENVAQDVVSLEAPTTSPISPNSVTKRSAAEAFDSDSVEDLKDKETTLDDVLVSPVPKKTRLLDSELPDVDDNEEFPQQDQEMDADLEIGLQDVDGQDQDQDLEILDDSEMLDPLQGDVDNLAPPEEDEGDTSQNNEIDIVDVGDEEVDSSGPGQYSEEDEEDAQETARAVTRAKNQREGRQLLQQLDDAQRNTLCLTALDKYGEELFYGHEDARDAILLEACSQDAILSMMREAIRVKSLFTRGSAAAPVELDDDDEEDEENGGYEDEEEEEEEEEEKPAPSAQNGDDVVVISDQEDDEEDEEEETKSDLEQAENSTNIADGSDDEEKDENAPNGTVASDADEEVGDMSVASTGDLTAEPSATNTAT